jgi:hypothetical protein
MSRTKRSRIILLLLLFSFHSKAQTGTQTDSIDAKAAVSGFLATSFMLNKNWNEISNSSILLSANFKYKNRSSETVKTITEVNAELSYIRFIDSIWVKNSDRFYFSNIWQLDHGSIRQTVSLNITTQMTDTWLETEEPRLWKSGPLVPAMIIAGYGFIYKFSSVNYINLLFPAYKIGTIPVDGYFPDDMNFIRRTRDYLLYHQYGMQIQMSIYQRFAHKFIFENSSNYYITRTLLKNFTVDIRNTLSFFPVKNFKLRIENKILFDKTISDSFQFKYEFLLGLNIKW